MREAIFEEILKYSKEEIIQALKKTVFRPESILNSLPIIRYNTMCDKAQKISDEAQEALKANNLKLSMELFDKSNKIWGEANKFIDNINYSRGATK